MQRRQFTTILSQSAVVILLSNPLAQIHVCKASGCLKCQKSSDSVEAISDD